MRDEGWMRYTTIYEKNSLVKNVNELFRLSIIIAREHVRDIK